MITSQEISIIIYNIALLPVIFFSLLFLVLAIVYLIFSPSPKKPKTANYFPKVTVQIPVFNDHIATECVEHCLAFDYPDYEIHIVDDSTDTFLTQKLQSLADQHAKISYFHRTNRDGYKPGALQATMERVKGEIIVIFDADWKPEPDFLRKIVVPFQDKQVAIVQAKQTFVNLETNLVSRFAGYLLMIYHALLLPIHNKANTVFFCGTAGALRKSTLLKMGGWNAKSITEDADLSVKILAHGYKNVYMNLPVKSEVPITLEGFIKQQMRWCYGLTRAFFDNAKLILFSKHLKLRQRILISFTTLGNIAAPAVIIMTIFGMVSWFIGDPSFLNWTDAIEFIIKFSYTSGFLLLAILGLHKESRLRDFPYLIGATFSVSLVLAVFNTIAVFRALVNKPLFWYCTPKSK